jgi:phage shock protein PspC (stress-responsive transcriptional regulator)
MKHVEIIHLNGIAFSIDDDAYDSLSAYMDALGNHFKNEPGGEEIIADIENRVAELFSERPGGVKAIVTSEEVARVMATLGTVEDIAGTAPDAESAPRPKGSPRRLYRDPDRRYLGGVCAGLANWTGITPLVIRLVFIAAVFFWGFALLVYLVLWLLVPLARTTAQKLEMHGQPVNINNIARSIKESSSYFSINQSINQFTADVGELFGKLFRILGNVACLCLGALLCLSGLAILAGVSCMAFMQDFLFMHEVEWDLLSFNDLLRHVVSPVSYYILYICGLFITLSLVFACFFWGIWLVIRFKLTRKFMHLLLFLVWLAAVILAAFVTVSEARHHAWPNEVSETRAWAATDTLYLEALPSSMKLSNNPIEVYYDKQEKHFYGKPYLSIRRGEAGEIKLVTRKQSQGESRLKAYENAGNIDYRVDARDSLLVFPLFFTVLPRDEWKFQRLSVTLYVPEGTIIVANKTLRDKLLPGVTYKGNPPYKWVMTRGLKMLD